MVEVHGIGFVEGSGLVCRFGDNGVPVTADFLSENLIQCRSRPQAEAGNVTLEVSINNQDFSSSGSIFEYRGSPTVAALRPSQGPVGGGTLIEVPGGPFSERAATLGTIYCRFGAESLSRAQRVSVAAISCVSPAYAAGEVSVEVSENGLDFTTSGQASSSLGRASRRWSLRSAPSRAARCLRSAA